MEANTIDIVSQWDQCGGALGAYLKQDSPRKKLIIVIRVTFHTICFSRMFLSVI